MMKKIFGYLFVVVVAVGFVACDDSQEFPNGYIQTTEDGASTFVMEGYLDRAEGFTVLKPEATDAPIFIQDKMFTGSRYKFGISQANGLAEMTQIPSADEVTQAQVAVTAGTCYWALYNSFIQTIYIKFRVASIDGNDVAIEYSVLDPIEYDNANVAVDGEFATDYSIPSVNPEHVYIEYKAAKSDNDATRIFNYAIEYDAAKKHAVWVAFNFDAENSLRPEERSDAWGENDPNMDDAIEPTEAMHKGDGFDKGHLVASSDRLYSKEANKQTFYYGNISPQIGEFNQNFWRSLEDRVQAWGRSTQQGVYDKVYVVKGGTTSKALINFTGKIEANDGRFPTTDSYGLTLGNLFCPAAYFMALLGEKDGEFQAIGFLVPHQEGLPKNPAAEQLQAYAMSIDELEAETGIDFFCNLPTVIETSVQESYDKADWSWN